MVNEPTQQELNHRIDELFTSKMTCAGGLVIYFRAWYADNLQWRLTGITNIDRYKVTVDLYVDYRELVSSPTGLESFLDAVKDGMRERIAAAFNSADGVVIW